MLVIDGTYLIYRSYYHSEKLKAKFGFKNTEHQIKVARNYFIRFLFKKMEEYRQDKLFIFFDSEKNKIRNKLLPTYKKNRREKPSELPLLKNEVYRFLTEFHFWYQISEEEEADDLIASFAKKHAGTEEILIYTGDGDLAATVKGNVTLLLARKNGILEIREWNFHNFFPVPSNKIADWKALHGDKSDGIKGVGGLFFNEAIHLLLSYGSVEEYYKNGQNHYLFSKMIKVKEKVMINKEVAKLLYNVKVNPIDNRCYVKKIIFPEKLKKKLGI